MEIMKKLSALILAILMLVCSTACGNAEVKFLNSDFEGGQTSNGGITDWQRYDYYGKMEVGNPYTEFSLEDHDGGKALCIYNKQPNDARLYQHIATEGGKNYLVTLDVKTEGVTGDGAGLNISALDYGGTTSRVIGNTDWQQKSFYITVDSDKTDGFNLCLSLGGYAAESVGKAYFDNLTIKEVDTVPEGADSIRVWNTSNTASEETDETTEGQKFLNALFKIMFFVVIGLVAAYSIIVSKQVDKKNAKNKLSLSEERVKNDKHDIIIMVIMTALTLVFSIVNLGDMKAASNYWKAENDGDYVIVEFDKETEVRKTAYSSNIPTGGKYVVSYEDADGVYRDVCTIEKGTFFEWAFDPNPFTAKRVKVTAVSAGLALNEIGFLTTNAEGEYEVIPAKVVSQQGKSQTNNGEPAYLFDEQDTVPSVRSYMNGTYFDEIYFPRTAYENIHGLSVYETTHPPLGKLIIALGITIFGMNPFGWRIMGVLFGAALVPIMYLFGRKIFKKRIFGFTAAFLMMFDFMRLAQPRLATIDTYSVFFVLLMYYYMYDYFTIKSYDLRFKQSLVPLGLCGLCFGLGIASKWTSVYAGAGLAFMFFLAKYLEQEDIQKRRVTWPKEKKSWQISNFLPTILACIVFFIIIPGTIYVLSYIPYKAGDPDKSLFTIMLENQISMFNYHSGLNATHSFQSSWWAWPTLVRPIWYYSGSEADGLKGTITSMGNPAVWWTGIAAVISTAIIAWKKKDKRMVVIFVAFAMQYCPWMLVTRCTFIYHFFTSVPFVILMIVYCFEHIFETAKLRVLNIITTPLIVSAIGAIAAYIAYKPLLMPFLALLITTASAYMLEKFGDKKIVSIVLAAVLLVLTVVFYFLMRALVPLAACMIVAVAADYVLRLKNKKFKGQTIWLCYLALVLGLFVAFYPVLTGNDAAPKYIESLRWLPSWYF